MSPSCVPPDDLDDQFDDELSSFLKAAVFSAARTTTLTHVALNSLADVSVLSNIKQWMMPRFDL
jgi:hypothetical protein